jgi:hypothetical protein
VARSSPGDTEPEQPKKKPELKQPFQKPPKYVLPRQRVTLPEVQEVKQQPKPEVASKRAPTSTTGTKSEGKTSIQRKKPLKVEEKASKPEVGSKKRKKLKFSGAGGRIHSEAQIDRILDEFILTGKLPSYVSERQRYDYRHHLRLPERRKLLDKQQTGDKASGTSTTTGTKDNITPFRGTGTHDN